MSETLSPEVMPLEPEYLALRETCGWVDLAMMRVIELRGDDRKGWLQGQATHDLRNIVPGSSISFCLASPTGQLEAICQLWALPDRYLIVTHEKSAPAVMRRVETMVILENVEARVLEGTLLSVQGPLATQELGSKLDLPNLDAGEVELKKVPAVVMRNNRTGFGGWDVFFPGPSKVGPNALKKGLDRVSESAFRVATMEFGVPEFGVDTDAKTLPPELGAHFEYQHISYSKGCYTGQEVLMRLHSRGHTNRTWCALLSAVELEPGATVRHRQRESAGVVTRTAYSPDFGWMAGAMLRNEIAQEGESVEVQVGDRWIEAEVALMPLLRLG